MQREPQHQRDAGTGLTRREKRELGHRRPLPILDPSWQPPVAQLLRDQLREWRHEAERPTDYKR